jgi:cholesterol transport system auxiliary component
VSVTLNPLFQFSFSRRWAVAVLAGAAFGLGACGGGSAPITYDLTAPRDFGRAAGGRSHLVIAEPTATQALDSERVIVRDSTGAISFLGGVQWADRLTKLVQTRMIQTFENGARIGTVGRPGDRVVADWQLNMDIRSFAVDAASGEAVVEITAKLVNDRTGKVGAARLFSARQPVGSIDGPQAARSLDEAMGRVLVDIARWTRV